MPRPDDMPTKPDLFPLFRRPTGADAPRLGSLRDEIDRLFDLFPPRAAESFRLAGPRDWTEAFPAMDLSETGDGYRLTVELPGLSAQDVDLRVKDGLLVISGQKSDSHEEKDADHHLSERRWGSFRHSLRLPTDADPGRIAASFARGVLTLTLPKSPAALAAEKTIPITEG